MIVYLVRVIPAFVMYCVNGASSSSLLIESTDSMIHVNVELEFAYLSVKLDWLPLPLYCLDSAQPAKLPQ